MPCTASVSPRCAASIICCSSVAIQPDDFPLRREPAESARCTLARFGFVCFGGAYGTTRLPASSRLFCQPTRQREAMRTMGTMRARAIAHLPASDPAGAGSGASVAPSRGVDGDGPSRGSATTPEGPLPAETGSAVVVVSSAVAA